MSRVTDIRSIAYGVANFAAERDFYSQDWGLAEVGSADGMAWFAAAGSSEHHVVRLRQSDCNHVDLISFATDTEADVGALFARVQAAGCRIVTEPGTLKGPAGGFGFRFFSPDGLPLEISCGVATRTPRMVDRWEGIPVRISHIVLHSPDHQAMVRFFTEVLGFRISDWLGDFMCFLRCSSAHHRVALLPGPPCLNHVAYDMTDVDGMMRGISHLKHRDIDIRWGPGRHTAGDNAFSYFVTPSGFAVEYTAELEEVDFVAHQAKVYVPAPRIMDQWGIGVGGPQTMPHAEADPRLFTPAEA